MYIVVFKTLKYFDTLTYQRHFDISSIFFKYNKLDIYSSINNNINQLHIQSSVNQQENRNVINIVFYFSKFFDTKHVRTGHVP